MSIEKQWAIVGLMGHKTLVGILTEEERFGGKLGRIDTPIQYALESGLSENFVTTYFSAGSVHSIQYVDEETARSAMHLVSHEPSGSYSTRRAITAELLAAQNKVNSQAVDTEHRRLSGLPVHPSDFIDKFDDEDRPL
jgi:hypothetical protein